MKAWLRRGALNLLLVGLSLSTGCLLVEGMTRTFLNPSDYLAAAPVPDEFLKHRIPPYQAGTDRLGFRNSVTPSQAEIVAIGDSWTWGINARGSENWPSQLASLTGKSVYGMALGGYGPLQYLHLLEKVALPMGPKVVVVGLYVGNDLADAFLMAHTLVAWKEFRGDSEAKVPNLVIRDFPSVLGPLGKWLSRWSLTYGLARAVFQKTERPEGWISRARGQANALVVRADERRLDTALNSARQRKMMGDWGSDVVLRDGFRITRLALRRMHQACQASGASLLVAVLPTKEAVYEPHLSADDPIRRNEDFLAVTENDERIERELVAFFEREQIPYVLTREALRNSLKTTRIFRNHMDTHPNGAGYRVIAESIAGALSDHRVSLPLNRFLRAETPEGSATGSISPAI